MAIYDCFQYFNEDHIVDLRLNILDQYVDFFVISESTKNHQGEPKRLNFKINNFSKFKKKIIYLEADPENNLIIKNHRYGHSLIEQHQRNFLINGLDKASDEDLILISDSDEIPDLIKLNLINPRENNWIGSRGCKKKDLIDPHKLRQTKFKNYPFWRIDKKNFQIINMGGWHFSYLLDLEKISEKIKSFSHSEDNIKENTEIDSLQKKLNSLIHPTKNYRLEKVKIDESYPDYILNNLSSFDGWITK